MKKNLLFVMPSLAAGGGEKSLINLLSQVNYDLYNIDLFLFSEEGAFMKLIPDEVNIIKHSDCYRTFKKQLAGSLGDYLRMRRFDLVYYRLMFAIKNRFTGNATISEQHTWKYKSKSIEAFDKEYDAAIGYLEKSSIYFIVDKIKSKKKIGWIHTNYTNSGMDKNFDKTYFQQLNHVVTVSEECAESLKRNFSDIKDRVKVIYNIVSPGVIKGLSESKEANLISDIKGFINIITVARLSYEKGIDMAIGSCKILLSKGYRIKWYVLGDGSERRKLESIIKSNKLERSFILLGIKENPYPYIKSADIYVQPSRFEGKSIAIDEAKILHKPIVVTNFQTAKDQIENKINGLIVDTNEESIAKGIEILLRDNNLRIRLINNLHKENLGTETEINKLYDIM